MRVRLLLPVSLIPLLISACAASERGELWGASPAAPQVFDARGTSRLPNGLEVLIVERPSPLVASLVLVKTGSSDESLVNQGVSHLLEHVVFDGTARRTKEELFREVYGMGGYLNGFTSEEYTGYILMAHPDFLERMLDIQADILFHSQLDPAKLEVTKGVVIEEIRQSLTNPAAREENAHKARLYQGTAYAHPVLGNEQVIRRLTRDEIAEYYRAHYVPNNMVAVLIGPVEQQAALAKLSRAFGGAVSRPRPARSGPAPAPPPRAEIFVEETSATRKSFTLSLIVPGDDRDRYPAWEVLAGILNERLRQAKDRPGAPRILKLGADFSTGQQFGLLQVTGTFPRETDAGGIRRLVEQEMARLATEPMDREAMARIRKGLVADEVLLAERIHYHAVAKAARVLALGAAGVGSYVDRIDRVTPEEVSSVAGNLAAPRYVASVFLPPGSPATSQSRGNIPSPQRVVLPNGLTVISQEIPNSPVFAAHVLIRGRGTLEGEGQEGLVEGLLRLLSRGTKRKTAEGLRQALQEIGGRLETAGDPTTPFGDFYTSREYGYVRLEALADHSREALALLAEILSEPKLAPEDIEKARGELLAQVEAGGQQPRRVAEALLFRTLFPGHPLAKPISGTTASLSNVRQDQLAALQARYLGAANLIVSIVSGLPTEAVVATVRDTLGRLPPGSQAAGPAPLPLTRGIREAREHLGKPQAQLLLGKVLPPVEGRERYALEIAGSLLSAKLFGTLREKEGLAYSIDAGVSFPQGGTLLLIGMGTAPQNVDRAKAGILREMQALVETPPTKEEIERRANGLAGRLTMRMLSSINRAFYLGLADFRGLAHGYGDAYRQALLSVTPEEVSEALRKHFTLDNYVLAIVD
jgi:zinc protease